jgi:hydrogenase nickel incorporation protein HypA/HybF
MHELSLALEVIDLVQREADKHGVSAIREIEIEVGDLSGVEAEPFQSALEMMVRDTILENATILLNRSPGNGHCSACDLDFIMRQRLDSCPECQCFPSKVWGGDEFRVISILTT